MSTKVFYTFYITKTPSQTGFGCRKSVENPVENHVENPCAPALRSQFGNAGLGVLTHRPSVCCQGGPHLPRLPQRLTCAAMRRHAPPCAAMRVLPMRSSLPAPRHLPCLRARLSVSPAHPRPGACSCPDRPTGPHLGSVTSTLAGTMPRGRGRSGWLVAPAGAAPPAGVAT